VKHLALLHEHHAMHPINQWRESDLAQFMVVTPRIGPALQPIPVQPLGIHQRHPVLGDVRSVFRGIERDVQASSLHGH